MPKKKKRKKNLSRRKKILKKRKASKIKFKKKVSKPQTDEIIYKTKKEWVKKALINKSGYEKKYKNSIKDNDLFWKKEGKRITWIKPYTKIKDV